jgi:hypothetical protein
VLAAKALVTGVGCARIRLPEPGQGVGVLDKPTSGRALENAQCAGDRQTR